jgi:choline kinase
MIQAHDVQAHHGSNPSPEAEAQHHIAPDLAPDLAPDAALPEAALPDAEVVIYFGDDPLRVYQLRQWLPVFELLHRRHRVLIALREQSTYALLRSTTSLPMVHLPTFGELTEMYRRSEHKVVVYVNNSARNFHSLVARSVLHVHVNHGESDKICMVSNQVKAYDQVFVAGEAAINRHRSTLIGFDHRRLVPVGRPQLDLRPTPLLPASDRRTVIYAPTWEGEEPSNNYSSVDVYGPQIVEQVLAVPQVRLVYKPHPRVASSNTPAMVDGHRRILELIDAYARRDPAAGHRCEITGDILAVFPGCDAMVTDVSSVGLDFLYLHGDKPLLIADRYGDPTRLRENAPVSRCSDVIDGGSLAELTRTLSDRLAHDEHHQARAALRRHYFGSPAVGESTERFIAAISDAIALRDRQVREREACGPMPSQPESTDDSALEVADLEVTILAAGLGSRLGMPFPKPLTPLSDGRSIMQQQFDNLRSCFGHEVPVTVVVGFRPDLIMAAFPDARFVFNERFDRTNTCKSLLKALRASGPGGMLWLNGDVVFDAGLLDRIVPMIGRDVSFVCVNTEAVAEEEVKYRVDDDGFVTVLSKAVTDGLGEAVGINYVASSDKATLIEHLERCADQDYFERGIESAIEEGLKVRPVDISEFFVVEVDFTDDLERANEEVGKTVTSAA